MLYHIFILLLSINLNIVFCKKHKSTTTLSNNNNSPSITAHAREIAASKDYSFFLGFINDFNTRYEDYVSYMRKEKINLPQKLANYYNRLAAFKSSINLQDDIASTFPFEEFNTFITNFPWYSSLLDESGVTTIIMPEQVITMTFGEKTITSSSGGSILTSSTATKPRSSSSKTSITTSSIKPLMQEKISTKSSSTSNSVIKSTSLTHSSKTSSSSSSSSSATESATLPGYLILNNKISTTLLNATISTTTLQSLKNTTHSTSKHSSITSITTSTRKLTFNNNTLTNSNKTNVFTNQPLTINTTYGMPTSVITSLFEDNANIYSKLSATTLYFFLLALFL